MTTSATFDETLHPRARDGRFVDKPVHEQAAGWGALTLAGPEQAPDAFSDDHGLTPGELLEALYTQGRRVMDEHGLTDWTFAYDSGRGRRLGRTYYSRKTIVLSAANMASISGQHRREILMHEIAHALSPQDEDHGPIWRENATQLGISPDARPDITKDVVSASAVLGTCPMGHQTGRGRMPTADIQRRMYCANRAHPQDQPHDERRYTWTRNELDPEVAAVAARHAQPRARATAKPGQEVRLNVPWHEVHGSTARVVSAGRFNYIVQVEGRKNMLRVAADTVEIL